MIVHVDYLVVCVVSQVCVWGGGRRGRGGVWHVWGREGRGCVCIWEEEYMHLSVGALCRRPNGGEDFPILVNSN